MLFCDCATGNNVVISEMFIKLKGEHLFLLTLMAISGERIKWQVNNSVLQIKAYIWHHDIMIITSIDLHIIARLMPNA